MMEGLGLPPVPLSPLGASPETLAAQLRSGSAASIARIASDFESVFVSLVLKEMRQTLEPGTLFGNDSGDLYGGLFDLFLGKHLVQAGGLGIGDMVKHYLNGHGTR